MGPPPRLCSRYHVGFSIQHSGGEYCRRPFNTFTDDVTYSIALNNQLRGSLTQQAIQQCSSPRGADRTTRNRRVLTNCVQNNSSLRYAGDMRTSVIVICGCL